MKAITFMADGIKIRTGKADGSADVVFTVGEYAIKDIAWGYGQ